MQELMKNDKLVMSSSELCELVGFKNKSSVNKAIKAMFSEKIDDSVLESLTDSRGYVVEYYLPELESTMFVAKHRIEFLEKITQFWIDVKNKNRTNIPSNFADALQLAADQQREIQRLEEQRKLDAPKVEFHDLVVSQASVISMNEFAKELTKSSGIKIGQNKMMDFLRESKILMKGRDSSERNKPYQMYMNLGWFEVQYPEQFFGRVLQTYVTPVGKVELAPLIVNHFKNL